MENLDFEGLVSFVRKRAGESPTLTFHSIGDTDCVASAIAVSKAFKSASISAPDLITANARHILDTLGFQERSFGNDIGKSAGLVVLLDVNNFKDCGSFADTLEAFGGDILIIDHHAPTKIAKDRVYVYNDERHNSAASIVYDLLTRLGITIEKDIALLLLAGIVSDSADLKNAYPDTFIQVGKLLKMGGVSYSRIVEDIKHVAGVNVRVETIEDVSSSKKDVVGDYLYMHGETRSHASAAADMAIRMGADVALYFSTTQKELSYSSRLRPPLDEELGIHLGGIMKELAKKVGGTGGGHPCAAGAYAPLGGDVKEFEGLFTEKVKGLFGGRP